jgi:hypothetical protein
MLILLVALAATLNSPAPRFDSSRVNEEVVAALRQAWESVDRGVSAREAGVVVVEEPDGRYRAISYHNTESILEVRMVIPPGAVAAFHTHPNSFGRRPSIQDRKNSDRLQIPYFIMTNRGLWRYDPATGKTTQVMPMVSWLNSSHWKKAAF